MGGPPRGSKVIGIPYEQLGDKIRMCKNEHHMRQGPKNQPKCTQVCGVCVLAQKPLNPIPGNTDLLWSSKPTNTTSTPKFPNPKNSVSKKTKNTKNFVNRAAEVELKQVHPYGCMDWPQRSRLMKLEADSKMTTCTWMPQRLGSMVSKWVFSPTYKWGIPWGYNLLS